MTTHDSYVSETPRETWNVPVSGDARFTWEYDEGRARLLALYQKGKDKQWDASTRIDWSLEVNKYNVLGLGEEGAGVAFEGAGEVFADGVEELGDADAGFGVGEEDRDDVGVVHRFFERRV